MIHTKSLLKLVVSVLVTFVVLFDCCSRVVRCRKSCCSCFVLDRNHGRCSTLALAWRFLRN
jgi:hypothetical protein